MFRDNSQFYKPEDTEQKPNQVVDISYWSIGELSHYPQGTRAKSAVNCPLKVNEDLGFLIPEHRYLWKKSIETKGGDIFYEQFWTEIIAYKLGRILEVEVPPAFVASYKNPSKDAIEYGCLIEWYYDYPNAPTARLNRGGDFMSRAIPHFDRKKGKLHNWGAIKEIFKFYRFTPFWESRWAEIFLFDAIIGNTDRHQENWEIYTFYDNDTYRSELSPAFDNGTSMGYEILDHKIQGKLDNIETYVNKGTHHIKWNIDDEKNVGHFELLEKLLEDCPNIESVIKSKLSIDISKLQDDLYELKQFEILDERYRLSDKRADFILKLINYRFEKLKKMFV